MIQIKSRFSGALLFEAEVGSLKLCLEAAVEARANLAGADLAGAYLADAGQDRRGYRFWAWFHAEGHVVFRAGCREWASIEDARSHFGDRYRSEGNRKECLARLDLLYAEAVNRGWIKP